MGVEKQGSKGGNYVGGFLQMFDWNAKSRKKLFSSKSDLPEQSKQKKRCDGNLPTTRLQMLELDDMAARSSVREGSDYSCSSSLVDEDFNGTRRARAPGVVARLMGLDSLPKSTPESLHDLNYYHQIENLGHYQDRITKSDSPGDLPVRKPTNRLIQKFQSEILPPKSAKSIPITHHKLMSPIKSAYFTLSKDPARIMEEASRIIASGPGGRSGSGAKTKLPPIGSSSAPLRVVDFKERARSARRPGKVHEGSQRKDDSSAAKKIGKSDSEIKGRSISLALQAKANVRKREGLSVNKRERSESSPNNNNNNNPFKSQPASEKKTSKKPHIRNAPNVLRQNNQKQNCIVDRGKSPKKCGSKKVSPRKFGSESRDNKIKMDSSSSSERSRKRSVDGNYHHSEPAKNAKGVTTDGPISWDQDRGKMGTDVVSFTFTAPMTRSGSGSRFSSYPERNNSKGGDALNTLLEQKLRELAQKVEFSRLESSGLDLRDVAVPDRTDIMSSTAVEENEGADEMEIDNQGMLEEFSMSNSNVSRATKSLDCWLPSPVSVLELSPFAESCNSSDTVDSYSMRVTKQCSSARAQELLDTFSSKMFLTIEGDGELSGSSPFSSGSVGGSRQTTLNSTNRGESRKWEVEYVKEILLGIDQKTFEDYAVGRTRGIVQSHVFDLLEKSKGYISNFADISRTDRRLVFDIAGECLDSKCSRYVSGGRGLWAKGLSVIEQRERLAEEVCKEISGWSGRGDSMIDELVDKDMSSQYGKWVDFDIEVFELGIQIECRVLSSLIDEVVSDILVL